jgi:hypothetical protein
MSRTGVGSVIRRRMTSGGSVRAASRGMTEMPTPAATNWIAE